VRFFVITQILRRLMVLFRRQCTNIYDDLVEQLTTEASIAVTAFPPNPFITVETI
jgi:hypothetical protein